MYGYHELTYDLTDVFNQINQTEIFKHIFGDFNVGEYICSPFRKDDSPGCWIQFRNGKLYFTDFGSSKVNLDAIGIIQEKYSFSFREAIEFVLNFKAENKESEYFLFKQKNFNSDSGETYIEVCPKPFDNYQMAYWSQFGITSTQLIQDNVFAVKWYSVNTKSFTPFPIEACYSINFGQAVKICRPKAITYKWITNVTKNTIGGYKSLPFLGKDLFISKSYKDWRVLSNLGLNSIYFQNEGMFPEMEVLETYLKLWDNVYILFDNDDAGKNASLKLKQYINNAYPNKSQILTLPTIEKDPADIIKAGKKSQLQQFLNLTTNENS
jgi:5S rRNA maturation endonuclease (ribonuclease M5)